MDGNRQRHKPPSIRHVDTSPYRRSLGGVVQQNSLLFLAQFRMLVHLDLEYLPRVASVYLSPFPSPPLPRSLCTRLLQHPFLQVLLLFRLVRSSIGVSSSRSAFELGCLPRSSVPRKGFKQPVRSLTPDCLVDVVICPHWSSYRSCQCYLNHHQQTCTSCAPPPHSAFADNNPSKLGVVAGVLSYFRHSIRNKTTRRICQFWWYFNRVGLHYHWRHILVWVLGTSSQAGATPQKALVTS
jgi:hypothetical protein